MKLLCMFLVMSCFGVVFEGENLPDSITVEGKNLKFNGAAKRVKLIFDVYIGALYLEKPTHVGTEVINSTQVKRVEMKFLRNIDKSDLVSRMEEVFELYKNPESKNADLQTLSNYFQDMKKGESIVYLFTSQGVKITVAGQDKAIIPGKNFSEILLKGWFADNSTYPKVRDGLLGVIK